jgi:hypothetical protein
MGAAAAERLRDLMARAMCPDEWAEFDAGNGVCSNMAGWAILDSIKHASRAYRALLNAGVALPEPPAPMAKDEHLDRDAMGDLTREQRKLRK